MLNENRSVFDAIMEVLEWLVDKMRGIADYSFSEIAEARKLFQEALAEADAKAWGAEVREDGEVLNSRTEETYTEQEYQDYGWARANNILNEAQNEDYRSKFADAVANKYYFPKTKNGEWIIPVKDSSNPAFEDLENVLVFAKGKIDKPIITSIIEIYEYDETVLADIREVIFENEKRGIRSEISWAIRRYYAEDFKYSEQRRVYKNDRNNQNNELGRGDSRKSTRASEEVTLSPSEDSDKLLSRSEDAEDNVKYFPPGEDPRRDIKVPSEVNGKKVRRTYRTAAESPALTPEMAEDVVSEIEKVHRKNSDALFATFIFD